MESNYERLQHRDDAKLPPLPDALVRGNPKSILDPIIVHDVQLVDSGPRIKPPAEQIKEINEKLRVDAGLPKMFDADKAIGDPQVAIAEWKRLKKLGLL